jgi:DNA-binding MarR family transcriptional regulator
MQYMRKATLANGSTDRRTPEIAASRSTSPVLPLDRAACACAVLRRAARRVTQLYDEALAPAGLRITQYSLLANLDRHGAVAMTELAELLGMDRTTLTRNIGPLQRDGYLSLRATGHGRTKLVTLTERGRRRLRKAFPYWLAAQERFAHMLRAGPTGDLADIAEAIVRA